MNWQINDILGSRSTSNDLVVLITIAFKKWSKMLSTLNVTIVFCNNKSIDTTKDRNCKNVVTTNANNIIAQT